MTQLEPSVTLAHYVGAFVKSVAEDPWTASYRKRPVGVAAVIGWEARLGGYFWPRPGIDRIATAMLLASLCSSFRPLVTKVQTAVPWTTAEGTDARNAAAEVFRWGKVPQDPSTVTPINVRAVLEAAVQHDPHTSAPMNSGWTKVAALATAHLPDAQVIWDSRVSASIVRRLDALFLKAGLTAVPKAYSGIGIVPGQGGTRLALSSRLLFPWKNVYGRWSAQIAASRFVRLVCDELNSGTGPVTGDRWTQRSDPWTVRDVEMVLFMDGY